MVALNPNSNSNSNSIDSNSNNQPPPPVPYAQHATSVSVRTWHDAIVLPAQDQRPRVTIRAVARLNENLRNQANHFETTITAVAVATERRLTEVSELWVTYAD
ncbi:hypothetical protein ColTof4_13588 [Colletotrichum tofieldiae]|nr:hypothetical protein ColTof4_13588 [Colletotrichum tofieldiae]GKT97323.1 hypothetical protein Ct61P_15173 [Colletotrichum tofieldiae]